MAEAVVVAHEVVRRFGAETAVDGVSLRVDRGACYALLGPNGAGKTTLSRMVGAVSPRDGGALTVFGMDPWREPTAVKSRTGWVMQEDALDDELDVEENLRIWGRFHGLRGAEFRARAARVLPLLGLEGRERQPIQTLSGGYRRRLVLARALLADPELLILDEPTTGLDPQVRRALWSVLRGLRDGGLTILLTTHYMEEAAQIADAVGVMHRGRLVAEGAPEALVRSHVPRYVLEVDATEPEPGRDAPCPGARVRRHGDRVHAYHDDESVLRACVAAGSFRRALVRPSTLEDVFLEVTGSALDG